MSSKLAELRAELSELHKVDMFKLNIPRITEVREEIAELMNEIKYGSDSDVVTHV